LERNEGQKSELSKRRLIMGFKDWFKWTVQTQEMKEVFWSYSKRQEVEIWKDAEKRTTWESPKATQHLSGNLKLAPNALSIEFQDKFFIN